MTANAPLLVIHPLFGDQQNGSHGHQPAADHIENGSADAAGGGQGRTFIVSYVNAYTRLYVIVYRCGYTCAIITGITISGGDFEPYRSSPGGYSPRVLLFHKDNTLWRHPDH